MSHDDDLERLLGDAFDRQARASVPDRALPPRPRFLDPAAPAHRRRAVRLLAPLAAAAAVIAVVAGALVIGRDSPHRPTQTAANPPLPTTSAPTTAQSTASGPHVGVHVKLFNGDGQVVGVGMPVIAYFSKPITDAAALSRATTLTVNGKAAQGAWYFERSATLPGYPLEAHFRMADYWPATSKISIAMPIKGLPAGGRYAFDDSLSLNFRTGPEQIVTVDDAKHSLVVTRDGATLVKARVSLGANATPTRRGVKVIMEKGRVISMRGPGYYDPKVEWTQRLTYSGEYLHSAPWNTFNIERGVDSSNGCTNLEPKDAQQLYSVLRVGDVVRYPDATGAAMTLGDGFGDWNVPWATWRTGGAVPTS